MQGNIGHRGARPQVRRRLLWHGSQFVRGLAASRAVARFANLRPGRYGLIRAHVSTPRVVHRPALPPLAAVARARVVSNRCVAARPRARRHGADRHSVGVERPRVRDEDALACPERARHGLGAARPRRLARARRASCERAGRRGRRAVRAARKHARGRHQLAACDRARDFAGGGGRGFGLGAA